jgi:energy-coupling factor transporter transmembrane protein EcfT
MIVVVIAMVIAKVVIIIIIVIIIVIVIVIVIVIIIVIVIVMVMVMVMVIVIVVTVLLSRGVPQVRILARVSAPGGEQQEGIHPAPGDRKHGRARPETGANLVDDLPHVVGLNPRVDNGTWLPR